MANPYSMDHYSTDTKFRMVTTIVLEYYTCSFSLIMVTGDDMATTCWLDNYTSRICKYMVTANCLE